MIGVLEALDQFGWASLPGCLGPADCLRLRAEGEAARDRGAFRRAGVGRGQNLGVRDDVRRDDIMWLQTDPASVEQLAYLASLETLRLALNQRLFLGLFRHEAHFAIYPEGGFYKPHLDRHAATQDRLVSTVLYLNPNWQPGDGGELKLWTTPGDKTGAFVLIEPRLGTFVSFLAGDFWHEVLPATKPRMSITGWFCQR